MKDIYPPGELVGTVWEAKDGSRTVRIVRDSEWLGERQLEAVNLETRRVGRITYSGLSRKFNRSVREMEQP